MEKRMLINCILGGTLAKFIEIERTIESLWYKIVIFQTSELDS